MKFEFHFFQERYPWHTKAPTIIIKLPIIMKPQPNITAKPRLTMRPASFMPTSTARHNTAWPTRAEWNGPGNGPCSLRLPAMQNERTRCNPF